MMKNKKIIFVLSSIMIASLAQVSFGQSGFGGMRRRSASNVSGFSDTISSFHGSTGSAFLRKSGSAYRSNSFSQQDLLQSSTGGSFGARRSGRGSSGLNFGSVGLSGGQSGGLSQSSGNLWRGGSSAQTFGSRSMPNMNNYGVTSGAMFGDTDVIILLPEEQETMESSYRREWEKSALCAIAPFEEKELQRPNLDAKDVMGLDVEYDDGLVDPMAVNYLQTEKLGLTTSQGGLYTTQQISLARKYVRQWKFAQALNCYQAARSVDPENMNALIGIALSHMMTGKLQAGGVNVALLAKQHPDFWKDKPDFLAIFGVSESKLVSRLNRILPEIDHYLNVYRAADSKEMADNISLVNLSKMFLAWMRDDQATMKTSVQAAAEFAPLNGDIQSLYREMVGGKAGLALEFESLEPLK